jgi:hypothetical protein
MQHSANIGAPPRALAKAPTGIQGLDEITNGGICEQYLTNRYVLAGLDVNVAAA